jgi:hypothetical protein
VSRARCARRWCHWRSSGGCRTCRRPDEGVHPRPAVLVRPAAFDGPGVRYVFRRRSSSGAARRGFVATSVPRSAGRARLGDCGWCVSGAHASLALSVAGAGLRHAGRHVQRPRPPRPPSGPARTVAYAARRHTQPDAVFDQAAGCSERRTRPVRAVGGVGRRSACGR